MYIEQFKYLKTVAETHSLRLAGERLFITEQALSTAIRKLEKECGVPLLDRSHKGVTLTEQGAYVLEKGQLILDALEDIERHFQLPPDDNGAIFVMALPHLVENLLSPVMMYYNQHLPETSLILETGGQSQIFAAVEDKSCDLGVVSAYTVNGQYVHRLSGKLAFVELFSLPLYIAVAPDSPLAARSVVRYEELTAYPEIIKASAYDKSDYLFQKTSSADGHKVLFAPNSKAARLMLQSNMGWLATPYTSESEKMAAHQQLAFLRLEDDVTLSIGLCHRKDPDKKALIDQFRSIVENLCDAQMIHGTGI